MPTPKVFQDGEELFAGDVNEYLVNPEFNLTGQAGTGVVVPSGSGPVNVNVSYPQPFPAGSDPVVFVTVNSGNLTLPRVTGRTTEGFIASFTRSAAGTYNFTWVAVVP